MDTSTRYQSDISVRHRRMNLIHSILLVLTLTILLALLGWALFGEIGVAWMVLIGLAEVIFGQRVCHRVVMQLYNARPFTQKEMPYLYKMAEDLAAQAELKTVPELYYIPSRVLNAFAVGVNASNVNVNSVNANSDAHGSEDAAGGVKKCAIGLTDGIIRSMSARELTAVMAHEISHIRNNDMWVMSFADTITLITNLFSGIGKFMIFLNLPIVLSGNSGFSWFGIGMLILAPFMVNLVQLALSRTREYDADAGAVKLTGDPQGMASALQKLDCVQSGLLSKIFMPGDHNPNPSIFRTHPHIKDRIARLSAMAGKEINPANLGDSNNPEEQPVPKSAPVRKLTQSLTEALPLPHYHFLSGFWY